MDDRERILSLFSSGTAAVAVYLAGQGPYREPKPIELQYMRITRYLDCLREQCDGEIGVIEVAVDLNHPRSTYADDVGFPQFSLINELGAKGQIIAVLGDLAQTDSRHASFQWVENTLNRHQVSYIDAGLDEGGFVATKITNQFGPILGDYLPSDAEDMLAFYPGLCDAIIYEFLDEAQRSDSAAGEAAARACDEFRSSLFEEKPYRIQRLPTFWVNKRDRLFREGR